MIKDSSFISAKEADNIENFVLGDRIPWFLNKSSVTENNTVAKDKNTVDHYQFTHKLYYDDIPQSQLFEEFYKIFISFVYHNEIEYKSLIRMKLNLVTKKEDFGDKYMPPHTDMPFDHKVFIYYVNDCDGDTILFDEEKKIIESITPQKGLGICFDGKNLHCNKLPVKNNFRYVLNVTFL